MCPKTSETQPEPRPQGRPKRKSKAKAASELELFVERYGRIILDMATYSHPDPTAAKMMFAEVMGEIHANLRSKRFKRFEKEWVLSLLYEELLSYTTSTPLTPNQDEQFEIDQVSIKEKLSRFTLFFRRLPVEDRFLLLGLIRHEIQPHELSSAMGIPIPSLLLRKKIALKNLHEQIWLKQIPLNQLDELEKHAHVIQIAETIQTLPKIELTLSLKKDPLRAQPDPSPTGAQNRGGHFWARMPWFIRSGIEGIGIAAAILLMVALVPKVKDLYEKNLESRLAAYELSELQGENSLVESDSEDLAKMENCAIDTASPEDCIDETGEMVESPEESEVFTSNPPTPRKEEKIVIGYSEILRFEIKTESPDILIPKIREVLTEQGVSESDDALSGTEVPGGIQFNLILPIKAVLDIKVALENVAYAGSPNDELPSAYRERFTWYKKRSRVRIPRGEARLVIWVSQI